MKYLKAKKKCDTYLYFLYVSGVSEETVLRNDIIVQKVILTNNMADVLERKLAYILIQLCLAELTSDFNLIFQLISRMLLEKKLLLSVRHHHNNIPKSGQFKSSLSLVEYAHCMVYFPPIKFLDDQIYHIYLGIYKT